MPNDSNARAASAVTAFVLFLALIEIAFTNATYRGAIGSIPIAAATGVIGLAMFLKLAHAVGADYKAAEYLERTLFWVPFLTLGVFGYRALDFYKDGYEGFMASIAIAGAVGAFIFGLADGVATIVGSKYKQAADALHEAQDRLNTAASVVAKGNKPPY